MSSALTRKRSSIPSPPLRVRWVSWARLVSPSHSASCTVRLRPPIGWLCHLSLGRALSLSRASPLSASWRVISPLYLPRPRGVRLSLTTPLVIASAVAPFSRIAARRCPLLLSRFKVL